MIKTASTCIWGKICEGLGGTCISYGCNCEPGSCLPPGWCCAPSSNENCYCALPSPSPTPSPSPSTPTPSPSLQTIQIPLFTIAAIVAIVGILVGITVASRT